MNDHSQYSTAFRAAVKAVAALFGQLVVFGAGEQDLIDTYIVPVTVVSVLFVVVGAVFRPGWLY